MPDIDRLKQKYSKSDDEIIPPLKKSPRFIKTEEHSIGGDVHTRKLHEEYYDETERITHVDDHEDVPREDEETITMKEGRVIKRERKEKFFDKNTRTIITRHAVDEFVPIERNEEIHSLDGFVYGREITEKSYNPKENALITRHGMDWKRLGCGHTMQKGATFYQCSVCGKTLCDDCGANINGHVFCNEHVLSARLLR